MKPFRAFAGVFCLIILPGCATILDGEKQLVSFSSSPNGVQIQMDGGVLGVTPFTKEIERGKDKVVVAKKEGYEDQVIALSTETNPKIFFNGLLVYVSLTGGTTDYLSGSYIEYSPNSYHITMTPTKASELERTHLAKHIRLQHFILTTYPNLQTDLARGTGEYVASLSRMLDSEGQTERTLVLEFRRLNSESRNAPAFAESIMGRFPCD
ncbi:MAG: PEGA domain-containing protein [Nitrospira sp.]|nr:PEGA domain-containing protein [Nitrospira sp.]